MATRRVVVTGAAGFLGAALVRRLAAGAHDVLAWVRPGGSPDRLAGVGARVLELDLRDLGTPAGASAAREALAAFRPDALVHAAWRGTRAADRDDPCQADNLAWAIDVVRLAAAAGATRFVGIGSQAEYGPQPGVITEQTPPDPVTLYGTVKLACGQVTLALARALAMSAAWVRVFSVYGPGERGGTLVSDLTRALRDGRPFAVGNLERRWDYLYEDDAGEALARLALRADATGVFNLASGCAAPLSKVVARIEALAAPGRAPSVTSRAAGLDELPRLEADVGRLARALAWEPEFDLDSGLARTVAAIVGERRGITAEG